MKLQDFKHTANYLERIGAEPRSLMKAVVREATSSDYWTDVAIIRFNKDGTVTSSDLRFEATDEEKTLIKSELANANWPTCKNIPSETDKNLPDFVKSANKEDVFWFRDINNNIIMAQVRKQVKGQRSYIPVTLWSDNEYRFIEPDGDLPLFGLETLKGNTTAFVHEGAKAAKYGQRIALGEIPHPWSKEFAYAAHVGFIGGALSPERTDWSILKRAGITRVIIVADNDAPGISAVPKISKALRCKTQLLQFTDDWPKSSDIADPFPKELFKSIGEKKYYIGPSYSQCLHPATYMTDLVQISEKKSVPVLRDHARNEWVWIENPDMFVNADDPEILRKADTLDSMLKPFSDSNKTSELILNNFTGRTQNMTYNPGIKGRKIIVDGETAINLYKPCSILPQEGDISPFLDFINYLVPDKEESEIVLKWIATLIARPEVHIQFALLMISNAQGSGKSLLGEILSRCVGKHNTSFPREAELLQQFTGWLAKKRLVIVNEVYSGSNWKLADTIKTFITDKNVSLRLMYKDSVTMQNFANFYCCSNASDAIKIDPLDRRWYIPTLTENVWSQANFDDFVDWLDSGGISIIMHWAETQNDYYRTGSIAPSSKRKLDMIDESESDSVKIAKRIAHGLSKINEPAMIGYLEIRDYIKSQNFGKLYESDQRLQKGLKENGCFASSKRMSLNGVSQLFMMNSKLAEKMLDVDQSERRNEALKYKVNVSDALNQIAL